jgi:hypothetical protein
VGKKDKTPSQKTQKIILAELYDDNLLQSWWKWIIKYLLILNISDLRLINSILGIYLRKIKPVDKNICNIASCCNHIMEL